MEKTSIVYLSERIKNVVFFSILLFFLSFIIYIRIYGIGSSKFLYVIFSLIVFFSPIFLIGATYSFLLGFKNLRLKQLIEGTATSKVRSVAIGFAEVSGKTVSRNPIIAPLSGSDCVYWQIIVFRINENVNFITIGNYTSSDNFSIHDETGEILINAKEAKFERLSVGLSYHPYGKLIINDQPPLVTNYVNFTSGFSLTKGIGIKGTLNINKNGRIMQFKMDGKLNKLPQNLKKFCEQNRIQLVELTGNFKDLIIIEYFLPVNKNIYAIGTVSEDRNAPNNMLMKKGQYVNFFYISDKHEKEVVKEIGDRARRWIISASALASISLFTIMLNWRLYIQVFLSQPGIFLSFLIISAIIISHGRRLLNE